MPDQKAGTQTESEATKLTLLRSDVDEENKENDAEEQVDKNIKTQAVDKPKQLLTTEELKEYHLQSSSQALEKACTIVKGQKALIKKLYSDCDDVIEECSITELRRAMWTASFIAVPEGRKLCARSIKKVTPRGFQYLMKKSVLAGATNTTCNHYGEIMSLAWKIAKKDEDEDFCVNLQKNLITDIMRAAIFFEDPLSGKFRHVLSSLSGESKKGRFNMNNMLHECFLPVLWRGTEALNPKVRYNAALVLFDFYPIICDDDCERVEMLAKQHAFFERCLMDDCYVLRHEAIKRVLKLMSLFWSYIPSLSRKNYFTIICDKLRRDADVGSRIAVFEGLRCLLPIPECMNSTEHALRVCCPKGIDDRNDRVRTATFELLGELKGHRYVRYFDVVEMDEVMARLEVETSETVRRSIVPLIYGSFLPPRADQNERMKRVARLISYGRISALTFHRLLFPLHLISVHDAVEHMKYLLIALKKNMESGFKDGSVDLTADENTTMGFNDTVDSLTGCSQNQPPQDEKNPVWQRSKVVFECFIVLWMSLKSALEDPKYAKESAKLNQLGTYLFKKTFQCFRDTSIIGPTMSLGSILPPSSMDGLTSTVLTLLNEKAVDDCILEPYLEMIAQWNVSYLLKIITSGFEVLKTCANVTSPARKKQKKEDKLAPNDLLRKASSYLKYLLRGFVTHQQVVYNHDTELTAFNKQLELLTGLIDQRLSDEPLLSISDAALIEAFSIKLSLSAVLLNINSAEDQALVFVRELCDLLRWFNSDVIAKMQLLSGDNTRLCFLCDLSSVVLRHIGVLLMSWDFAAVPTESRRPSFLNGNNSAGESQDTSLDFLELAMKTAMAFCSSSTPAVLIPSVLTAANQLLHVEDTNFTAVYSIFDFVPKWIIKCFKADDELDIKSISEAYLQLWKTVMEHEQCTELQLERSTSKLATLLLECLVERNEEKHDIGDPRSHDYELLPPFEIIVHRVILKNARISKVYLSSLGGLFMKSQLVSDELDADLCLLRLGSCAQLAYLSDVTTAGIAKIGRSTSAVHRCSEEVRSLLVVLQSRVTDVEQRERRPVDDFLILSQVKELLTGDT